MGNRGKGDTPRTQAEWDAWLRAHPQHQRFENIVPDRAPLTADEKRKRNIEDGRQRRQRDPDVRFKMRKIKKADTSNVVALHTTTSAPPSTPPSTEPGPCEQAAIDLCRDSPVAADDPTLLPRMRAMGRILDDPEKCAMHPTTNRQYQALADKLTSHRKRKSGGRLVRVQAMSAARNLKGQTRSG